jgi:hypothetical protein
MAAVFPDHSSGALKSMMLDLRDASGIAVFARDSGSGSVSIDAQGRPIIRYWPDKTTQKHLLNVSACSTYSLATLSAACMGLLLYVSRSALVAAWLTATLAQQSCP